MSDEEQAIKEESSIEAKVPLVLFSGGLDSTFLVYKLLQESDVDLLTIDSNCLPGTIYEAEKQVREDIINYFAEHKDCRPYRGVVRNVLRFTINTGGSLNNEGPRFAQPKYWLFGAVDVASGHKHSSVNIAYVSGDQIGPHIQRIAKAWKHLWSFSRNSDLIPLKFPLLYTSKRDIVLSIKGSEDEKLLDLIWYCERPIPLQDSQDKKFEPCGKCQSCCRMREVQLLIDYQAAQSIEMKISSD